MTRFAPLWQQAGSYPSQLDRSLLGALWPGGGGAGPAPSVVNNTMQITIPPGWLGVALQGGQGTALCRWDAPELVTLDASPPSGQQRWDAIVCQVRDTQIDTGPDNDFIFTVVKGAPAASGLLRPGDREEDPDDPPSPEQTAVVIPATPANAALVMLVLVTGGQANLNNASVFDRRPLGHCEVYNKNAYTQAQNVSTILYDTLEGGAGWDNAFKIYTAPMAGRYQVNAAIMLDRIPTGMYVALFKNAGEARRGPLFYAPAAVGGNPTAGLNAILGCVAGDQLQIRAYLSARGQHLYRQRARRVQLRPIHLSRTMRRKAKKMTKMTDTTEERRPDEERTAEPATEPSHEGAEGDEPERSTETTTTERTTERNGA